MKDTVDNPRYCSHCGTVRYYHKVTGEPAKFCVHCGEKFPDDSKAQDDGDKPSE